MCNMSIVLVLADSPIKHFVHSRIEIFDWDRTVRCESAASLIIYIIVANIDEKRFKKPTRL